jgi:dipeptidyl aminopeptidase/acylaminoacyl peptidase
MGYKTQGYRELYSVDYHIGKTAYQDTEEYKRRSPAWQAHKLETPLLVHSNTNDSDVNVLEVQHLIKSLQASDKEFEYEIYEDIPGGHTFDRIDTNFAREVRLKVYRFLGEFLNPPKPFTDVKALKKAGYKY